MISTEKVNNSLQEKLNAKIYQQKVSIFTLNRIYLKNEVFIHFLWKKENKIT